MSTRLISPDEVSERLQVPVATLYRWRSTNYGPPAIKVGKHLRYRQSDIDAFIEAQFAQEGALDATA